MPDKQEWSRAKATIYSWVWRNPRSNRMLVALADLTEDDRTLDIGCGPGAAVRAAAAVVARSVGVDRSPAMVDIARRRATGMANVDFEVGVAEALPFPDDSFTVAWSAHSYHHWSDPEAGLVEAARVLAPGGRLLIVEKRSTGEHGLSLDRADALSAHLDELGFTDSGVVLQQKDYLVSGRVC